MLVLGDVFYLDGRVVDRVECRRGDPLQAGPDGAAADDDG